MSVESTVLTFMQRIMDVAFSLILSHPIVFTILCILFVYAKATIWYKKRGSIDKDLANHYHLSYRKGEIWVIIKPETSSVVFATEDNRKEYPFSKIISVERVDVQTIIPSIKVAWINITLDDFEDPLRMLKFSSREKREKWVSLLNLVIKRGEARANLEATDFGDLAT